MLTSRFTDQETFKILSTETILFLACRFGFVRRHNVVEFYF